MIGRRKWQDGVRVVTVQIGVEGGPYLAVAIAAEYSAPDTVSQRRGGNYVQWRELREYHQMFNDFDLLQVIHGSRAAES
jgi:hypothetical protein